MSGDSKKLQPIIIKKVKKGGHAAHGGAWKIAYADFVTAMMAFFLLMWLLGSTTEGDKKGIADYFGSPLKIAMGGGSGSGDSSSVVKGGGTDLTRSAGQVNKGDVETRRRSLQLKALKAEQRRAEAARLESLKQRVEDVLAANPKLAALKSQIRLEMTRDGLRIQIVDEQSRPMFDSGSAVVKPYMRDLLREIGGVLDRGAEPPDARRPHRRPALRRRRTRLQQLGAVERPANASRRELGAGGLPEERVLLVQGLASSVLFDPSAPASPANRRISIIVMNREAENRLLRLKADDEEAAEPADPVGSEMGTQMPKETISLPSIPSPITR